MKRNRKKGFTLAETLIVVAIIVVLMGIAFVSVARYRRSMRQLEFDGYAKEIFIAAQNHLTMADNQGLLDAAGAGECGSQINSEKADEIFYFTQTERGEKVPSLMLPFGAVDETVLGGTYIIRYQKSSGLVLDVFYSTESDNSGLLRNLGTSLTGSESEYESLVQSYRGDGNKLARRNCDACSGAVVGWYGSEGENRPKTVELKAPSIQIINADKLTVKVTNPNVNVQYEEDGTAVFCERLKLHIVGKTSKAEATWTLSEGQSVSSNGFPYEGITISIDLDDITVAGKHFAEQMNNATEDWKKHIGIFIPGEDLEIWAEADSASALANIASSAKLTTNSLFASIEENETGDNTASIAYIRHLENLDGRISGFAPFDLEYQTGQSSLEAIQISDMDWDEFKTNTKHDNWAIQPVGTAALPIASGSYYPVDPTYTLQSYDGALRDAGGNRLASDDPGYKPGYSITGVTIITSGDAGLFAQIESCAVSNLELVNFSVTSSGGDAGALAAKAENANVTNVLVRHDRIVEVDGTLKENNGLNNTVSTIAGNAGGLIGTAENCTVTDCAASLYVSASGNAGGLIGSSSGTTLSNSYSGGHTSNGQYVAAGGVVGGWNVSGDAAAGGLIGSSSGDTLSGCYSTCSVWSTFIPGTGTDPDSAFAGGLIGVLLGTDITNCYTTGLVSEGGKTLVVDSSVDGSVSGGDNLYYGAVNPEMETGAYDGFAASVSASKAAYLAFFFPSTTTQAIPYDTTLVAAYKNKYPMKGSGALTGHFAEAHYGDWPLQDSLVYNY